MSDSGSERGSPSNGSQHYEQKRIEPMYDAFVCPLTKQVMRDPVSLDNGQTYERSAIERWFKECQENGKKPSCPMTGTELNSTVLNPSIALRNTIEEWTARNELAQINLARSSLKPENSKEDVRNSEEVLSILKDIQHLCSKTVNKHRVRNAELIPLIVDQLRSRTEQVRCAALETLRILAEDEEDNKEAIAGGAYVNYYVKCLSRELSQEREKAVSLLLELSTSPPLCERIGSVNGAILILVGMTSSKSENLIAVDKAEKTLQNLENSDRNVRQMAENGRLQPLLTRLVQGPEETQLEMANYLADIVLSNEGKITVAETASTTLVKLLVSGRLPAREASLKALNQISAYETNKRILIEAGLVPPLIRDLFIVGANQLPMRLKEISADILAHLVSFGFDFDSLKLDDEGHTIVSENIIHNFLHLISSTGPSIGAKLLQVLVGLASSSEAVPNLVAAIKSAGATITLVQFIETPQREVRSVALKLLQRLCPQMDQELADALRITTGQLSNLIRIIAAPSLTDEHVAAASLVANLPMMDSSVTRSLLDEDAFAVVVSKIETVRYGDLRGSRFFMPYLEALVGILARLTFLLDDGAALAFAKKNDLAILFTDLLQTNGLDEVQRLSAKSLENLSNKSRLLSEVPEMPKGGLFACCFPPPKPTGLCQIHHGICSARNTFCLLEAKALPKLISCLDNSNVLVVEASLAALTTLIDDTVDVERGVQILEKFDALRPILDILRDHKTEVLRQHAVWIMERILRNVDLARNIAADPNVNTALVDAFRHGNYNTRQTAEKALKHLNKIPNFSGVFHTIN